MTAMKPARTEHVTFPGGDGDLLAARLDFPAGPPRAFALFAHCFTCGKDLRSAGRLAAALTESGFAVLRFDFTGLGSSEGEFANTNFSSNTADLVAAIDWLRREHAAPQILVGHSLGGAAVLAIAGDVPEVNAVVTIGAPSDTEHLTALFTESIDEIATAGEACVSLAGRPFTITQDFVADLSEHRVLERVEIMRKPLLVMHSPVDETVGVDNAAEIYTHARHPKSFVSLDGADHLLSDAGDARFAAAMIAAFATRHVSDESGALDAPGPTTSVVVAETGQGPFLNHVVVGNHRFLADEPESIGGFDAGPSPYDFLGAALGACTSMTLRMYASRKSLPLDRVSVDVSHDRVHADDCADAVDDAGSDRTGLIDQFERVIQLEGAELTDADRDALLSIADRCPVHRTLESSSSIVTRLAPNS
ncbi:bifunctional alpha/beta hydrolase/OsmC family protein [Ilumatobacter nonamiensis]|uniref:bifunctional alpha/beta hydrolase/OsmC family protein n=1 Tax=Ilumatobacter nonamiensis TaxID=467093 RepID=UPI00034B9187|nr:bifunctional alpha/beta hydrolase/OsmC family protein [Ilumatobacter nonamiensis]